MDVIVTSKKVLELIILNLKSTKAVFIGKFPANCYFTIEFNNLVKHKIKINLWNSGHHLNTNFFNIFMI